MTAENFSGARPYGALELKQSYQQGLLWALGVAALLHIGAIWAFQFCGGPPAEPVSQPVPPTRLIETVLEVLPTLKFEPTPIPEGVPPVVVKPEFAQGRIVLMPDDFVTREKLLPTQTQLHDQVEALIETDDSGAVGVPGGLPLLEWDALLAIPAFDSFVVRTRDPEPLPGQPQPVYSDMARLMQVEGVVRLRMLVSHEGNVLEVRSLNPPGSISPLLEEAAMEVALQWRFIPALQQDRHVPAWYDQAFAFRLR